MHSQLLNGKHAKNRFIAASQTPGELSQAKASPILLRLTLIKPYLKLNPFK